MILDSFLGIFKVFFEFLKYPLYFILIILSVFIFSVLINIIIQLFKGKRFPKNERGERKKRGFLTRLFIDTPHQFVLDLFNKEPDFFPYQRSYYF